MDYRKKAKKLIDKFKKENDVTTSVSEILIETIAESLEAIESSKLVMSIDAEKVKSNEPKRKAGYGFMWSRLGDLKKHPGRDIIKDENKKILDNLKALCIRVDSKDDQGDRPRGLNAMIASKKKAG